MKTTPFTTGQVHAMTARFPTPFHIYDEKAIIENVRTLKKAFAWNDGFKEFFAVKAAPNPILMKILEAEGVGTDCSSMAELILSERTGILGEEIMFTSNDTPADEYRKARELGAIVNLDDISHIAFLEESAGLPELVCCRYNPGPLKGGNTIIGHPEEAKYGFTREQLFAGYKTLRDKGIKRFGLHTMVASNELDPAYFVETARILFELVADLSKNLGISFEFINLGGGIGIPYLPEQQPVDLIKLGKEIHAEYDRLITANGLAPIRLYLECGRIITGPYGYLVSKVLHIKRTYKTFVGLDACMANLMRPALYGAFHHISVVGKESEPATMLCDVTGSLCENNDKFAIDRTLPEVEPGDIVIIHDAGAHGHAMGFNYNGKLRSAELLLRKDGSVVQIRKPETLDDLFATLDFGQLADFPV
ncbi:MAG: diaminopimelate decarboxylase [Spartobacteria bacterium]|nr:diaminopimelate decarboxylase [Spartobacteria bacterium]